MPVSIQLSKISKAFSIPLSAFSSPSGMAAEAESRSLIADRFLVGLGRIELPTSPLSGVRSSQLSYRPEAYTGGAGRDRTGDLLNANQALSQLSYSPKIIIEASWMQKP